MVVSRIAGLVRQMCWGAGRYTSTKPILHCIEHVLSDWPFEEAVDVFVTSDGADGCHLHTKTLVKIGSSVYPLILSESCEDNLLALTQNDITYLLYAVIEETEQELAKLMIAGASILDPLTAILQDMEQTNDHYQLDKGVD